MREITKKEAEKILKEIKEFKETKGCRNYRDLLPIIEKYGFEDVCLGSGWSARTHSCEVATKEIKSRYYLNGTYLIIGKANQGGRKGVYYYGYALKVKD